MTTSKMAELVRQWFDQAGQMDGPLLPDGWFGGRRGEAGGFLEDVKAVGDSLVLKLSENKTLSFDQPRRVFVENSELVFDGFRQATLRWQYQGLGPDAPYYEEQYESGQIRLFPPVGTTVELL